MMIEPPKMDDNGVFNTIIPEFDQIPDAHDMAERFSQGFSEFIRSRQSMAAMELLREEFPNLANDDSFVERVIARLDHTSMKEKRFVFLAVNPAMRSEAEPIS